MPDSRVGQSDTSAVHEFGTQPDTVARFQDGIISLHYYGCRNCGNAFWTEGDRKRKLSPGPHRCPHCDQLSVVAGDA